MKKITFLLLMLLPLFLTAQSPIAFERYYDFGLGFGEEGYCVQQTNDHGYITCGRQTTGIGFSQMLLHKVDSLGNTQWYKLIGTIYENEAFSVKQTSDSGYIMTGYSTDVNYTNFITLVKTDANGNVAWMKNNISPIAALPQGGPGGGHGTDVIQTSDGGYSILAIMTDLDTISSSVLIKTNANGDTLWTKKYRRSFGVGFYSFQQIPDGSYIMAGIVDVSLSPVDESVYLLKTNVNGDTLWSKIYDFAGENTGCYNVEQTTDSGFFLRGGIYHPSSFSTDILIIKTDSFGDSLWSKTIGGNLNEGGEGARQTSDGGFIIAGGTTSYGVGGEDVYLVKTNSGGQTLWQRTFGGISNDQGDYIFQTNDKGFIICGNYSGPFGDGASLYLIKTDSSGNAPTGINEIISDENSVSVFPNPVFATSNIFLKEDKLNGEHIFLLYDFSGKEIRGEVFSGSSYLFNRNDLAGGMYLCVIQNEDGKIIGKAKVIVQ
ncbi:MAG: T9SS type A sorting domain-containing protein [Bacteroidetes bacterium]|nr:T9SS type A sorting domain-containing protein [Bacteroidota bacterium]